MLAVTFEVPNKTNASTRDIEAEHQWKALYGTGPGC